MAERHKWAPPAAWDAIDDPREQPKHQVANTGRPSVNEEHVDLALLLAGQSRLNVNSKSRGPLDNRHRLNVQAIHLLVERGLTIVEVAARLKLAVRTVERYRMGDAVGGPMDNSLSTTQAEAPHSAGTTERHHKAA